MLTWLWQNAQCKSSSLAVISLLCRSFWQPTLSNDARRVSGLGLRCLYVNQKGKCFRLARKPKEERIPKNCIVKIFSKFGEKFITLLILLTCGLVLCFSDGNVICRSYFMSHVFRVQNETKGGIYSNVSSKEWLPPSVLIFAIPGFKYFTLVLRCKHLSFKSLS